MSARRALTLWIAVVLVLGLAIPAGARDRTTGDRLQLLPCPDSFAADTAFHVRHGHIFNPTDESQSDLGEYLFQLEVDGDLLPLSNVRINEVQDGAPDITFLAKTFVYNFPEGLAGEHTLTGIWTDPSGSVELVQPCTIEFD